MSGPDWKTDLSRGDTGEQLFQLSYPGWIKGDWESRSRYDFTNEKTGETVELKTDYYPVEKTPNIFIERYSDTSRATDGGPYRCPDCTYYVYFFIKSGTFLWYPTGKLLERLAELTPGMQLCEVRNNTYITTGYKIRRALVADLLIQEMELQANRPHDNTVVGVC